MHRRLQPNRRLEPAGFGGSLSRAGAPVGGLCVKRSRKKRAGLKHIVGIAFGVDQMH